MAPQSGAPKAIFRRAEAVPLNIARIAIRAKARRQATISTEGRARHPSHAPAAAKLALGNELTVSVETNLA